jgi:putative exosortase-associated protein (TIGR04073 family)
MQEVSVQSKSIVAMVIGVVLVGQAWAADGDQDVTGRMAHKWARGITNALTGIVEVPMQTGKGWDKGVSWVENQPTSRCLGAGLGLFRGLGHGAGRTWSGVFEVVTFWAANPEDNAGYGVPLDNEHAWTASDGLATRLDKQSKGYEKMGRKLWRGACNTVMGVSEVPCQIGQEVRSPKGSVVSGTGVGLYMFVSRELYGVNELVTFLLPNPERNVGVQFELADPWNYLTGAEPTP